MNPISELINAWNARYESLDDVENQFRLRNQILELGIPGLVDVQFTDEYNTFRITPVFATEQDYMWYHLKYGNPL